MRQQIKVAEIDQVKPGQGRMFRVKGREIGLFNVAGRFYAIDSTCTHSRGPLAQGRLSGTVVTCPWHGAKFDVRTGTCLAGPADRDIATWPVHLENGYIFVEAP